MRSSVSLRWVVVVVVGLVSLVMAGFVAGTVSAAGRRKPAPAAAGRAAGPSAGRAVAVAVERTLSAGSARIDAEYAPASGPTVRITGSTSFVGPEVDVVAAVGGEPGAAVRVTAEGAWLRPPGTDTWTPIPLEQVSVAASRGWGDVLRSLDPSDEVHIDRLGRIVRARIARDRDGGSLDLRFSEFGTDVPSEPP